MHFVLVPITGEETLSPSASVLAAELLEQFDLPDLIGYSWLDQLRFLLNERLHLLSQIDFIRAQFEKQFQVVKRRLDEAETDNERLTSEHRSATKELLLYKHLHEASSKDKDYQQLRVTIDAVLKENERLYKEIHDFKTSDPVYEQLQLLESANKHLKQELIQSTHQNNRLKKLINIDEIKHLKSRLRRTHEECEQLKLLNKKLIGDIETYRYQLQASLSPQQVSGRRVDPLICLASTLEQCSMEIEKFLHFTRVFCSAL